MTSIPFDPGKDIAPIPFEERLCRSALALKERGLPWRPHVGCFVWDPEGVIESPSPFPNRIYFILSLPRFLGIFGTAENMIDKLVWLPTMHQAKTVCRQLGFKDKTEGLDIYQLYDQVGEAMTRKHETEIHCRLAVETQLGDVSDLPAELITQVETVYREFVELYLNMLRQKENRPRGWFPDQWSLDLELVDDMRHFFSDHQFITRKFLQMNAGIKRLREIDKERQGNLYRHTLNELLQKRPHAVNGET